MHTHLLHAQVVLPSCPPRPHQPLKENKKNQTNLTWDKDLLALRKNLKIALTMMSTTSSFVGLLLDDVKDLVLEKRPRAPAAEDGVPPSLQTRIPSPTHMLPARLPPTRWAYADAIYAEL